MVSALQYQRAGRNCNKQSRSDYPARISSNSRAIELAEIEAELQNTRGENFHWAQVQNNLANALQKQAARVKGKTDTELLTGADTACEAALTVYTKSDYPELWAETQQNLELAFELKTKLSP